MPMLVLTGSAADSTSADAPGGDGRPSETWASAGSESRDGCHTAPSKESAVTIRSGSGSRSVVA